MKKPIVVFRNPGKGSFVRHSSKWEDNIEKYFEEIGREDVEWNHMA
jgi:hypothetical protein